MATTFKIQYQSFVRCYAEHEIEAASPEEAARLALEWINGNVSALDWTDADGDSLAGEVEDGEIRFSVWEGGAEGNLLGDDYVLLSAVAVTESELPGCPKCGHALRLCSDNDPACAHCDHCDWCGDPNE